MARADLLISLIKAGCKGNNALFRKTAEAIIAEERSKQHNVLADQLAELLKTNELPVESTHRILENNGTANLFYQIHPQRRLSDMFLTDDVLSACQELAEEQHRVDLLRSHNLEPRHRILLIGEPGNGKTSLAEAIAETLAYPMLVVRYEGIIGTYLGETAIRLKRLFEYVRTRQCVLFFDEFDTLGKERGDIHDTGEIKRVVSSLLLQIDSLPSHVVVVTATNHPELLDRAVWRRFQVRLTLPPPTASQLEEYFRSFELRLDMPMRYKPTTLAKHLKGANFSDVELFCEDVLRQYVLRMPEADLRTILRDRLAQWRNRVSSRTQ